MKSPFEFIYKVTGAMAVACLAAIAAIVLADVALRQFGGQVRGSDDLSGYALVGTALLGLAPTYRLGEQIRVGLILDRLSGNGRRLVELLALGMASVMIGWATWWIGRFVYDSWRFHEIGTGLITTPLWIPQSLMLWGIAALFLALVEDFIRVAMGKPASYQTVTQAEGEVARYE
ncbi:MAG: TRAP transporter small permease subunit [Bosea sp. (in: a-proteobacteria)]